MASFSAWGGIVQGDALVPLGEALNTSANGVVVHKHFIYTHGFYDVTSASVSDSEFGW